MRKIAIALLSLLTVATAQAQTKSGKVNYKETIKLGNLADMLGEEMAQFAALLPKEQNFDKTLFFSPEASLYKMNEEKAKQQSMEHSEGGNSMKINFDNPDEQTYHDIKANKTIEQKEFMTRKFLVTSDSKKSEWKLTGKQKTILNYPSQEAKMMKDTMEVIAWFTPAIPVSTGPRGLGGLPGLILEVSIGEMMTIEASEITPMTVDKAILAKPKDGKKVTEEEMEEIVKEKTKEMQQMYGGSGDKVIIKMQR